MPISGMRARTGQDAGDFVAGGGGVAVIAGLRTVDVEVCVFVGVEE